MQKVARLLLAFLGGLGIAIGVTLIVKANVGADVTSVFFTGIEKHTFMSFQFAAYFFTCIILVVLKLIKTDIGVGTVVMALTTSLAMFATFILIPDPASLGLVAQIAYFISGIVFMGIGVNTGFASGLGNGIYEALSARISDVTGIKDPVVRTIWEALVLTTGIILGGAFGIGTIVFVVTIGPVVTFFNKQMNSLILQRREAKNVDPSEIIAKGIQ